MPPEPRITPPAPAPVLRFAPSPTGVLHLGHALSALLNHDIARRLGARLLVRIEDTDASRCRPEFTEAILGDLAWLGIVSDGPVLRQSEHLAVYAEAACRLEAMGLLYPCFASRQEIQAAARPGRLDPDGAPIYPDLWRRADPAGVDRRRASGEPFALRLDMGRALLHAERVAPPGAWPLRYTALDEALAPREAICDPARWGDVVIRRKDGSPSYHLAVVVDDARQAVTHVVRGADLEAATDIHHLLQVLLGLPAPLYRHHRLISGDDGRKLSKRDGATGLASLRRSGLLPSDIRRMLDLPGEPPARKIYRLVTVPIEK